MIFPSKEFLEIFKKTEGALSVTESIAIMNIASQSPPNNRCVEFGVFRGKSAMSALIGLREALFYLVEPEFNNVEFCESVEHTLSLFIGSNKFTCHAAFSIDWINNHKREYGYIFIDSGNHGDGLPMQEVKLLEDRMVKDGIIAFHDYKSQFIEVEEAYNYLLSTGKYEEIPINWDDIIAYVKENNLEEGNMSWHHTEMPFPNFVGAVKRK